MEMLRIIVVIVALANLVSAYLTAIDKLKPSKSTQILYFIIAAVALFGFALAISIR